MTLKDHLKLFLADFLVQVVGYRHERLIYGLLRLDTRQRNILRERRRMTWPLKRSVLVSANWTCAYCGVQNLWNRNPWKPKMEVDHRIALYNWGTSDRSNLQCLCKPCNRKKGVS